jgi:hypothetical protein
VNALSAALNEDEEHQDETDARNQPNQCDVFHVVVPYLSFV